jgi:SAM-dependent methyltransferase
LIEAVLDEFEREVSNVVFTEPRLALVSNLSGRLADLSLLGQSGYWRRHMREPVRFADSVRALAQQGITHYVEMSPHPVLLGMGSDVVASGQWLPSLREGRDEWTTIFESLQALYCAGATVDWSGLDYGYRRRRISLPTYPFQRKRHWIETGPTATLVSSADRWQRLADTLDRQAVRGPLDVNVASYPDKYACLARLTRGHAIATLRRAGLFLRAGEVHTLDEVREQAHIGPAYRHLLQRWLESLVADGVMEQRGNAFHVCQGLADPDLPALWEQAERLLADNRPLFDYVRHCGNLVSDVLCGRESPLETLFPGGAFDLAQNLYERSATMLYINQLAGAAFEALGALMPPGRTLRVLEVGAGTGGTSSSLLSALPAAQRLYRFTDVSDVFLDRARQRFGDQSGIEFDFFDLDAELEPQGYAAASFDVIVAANAVHAAKNLRVALDRLHHLLAPGGFLILIESTAHLAYFDMTTGLIEGWQHFADDLRRDNPLLSAPDWVSALDAAGFARARSWPEAGSPAEALGQHVIVAQMPGDAVADITTPVDGQKAVPTASVPTVDARGAWLDRLEGRSAAERIELLRELVRAEVMKVMRLDSDSPPARHDRLMELGMDSLMAVQLRNALNQALALDRPLSSTVMFDYPTIDAMAAHLHEWLTPAPAVPPTSPASSSVRTAALGADAVAAMSDAEIERLLDERLGAP